MVRSVISGIVGAGVFALAMVGYQSSGKAPASYASLADSVVKVEYGSVGSYGSGVLVAPDKVLTAKHIVQASNGLGGVIETKDRRIFAMKKIIVSPTMDIAVIILDRPIPFAKPARVTTVMPVEDTPLLAIGHPLGTHWAAFRFTLSGKIEQEMPQDEKTPAGSLVVQGASNPGLSGGPAFNPEGEAVGLLTHSINEGQRVRTGLGLILPFASVKAVKGDPVKEALGW